MAQKEPFAGLTDRTPRYTVKEVAEKLGMTAYTVRYYDNAGLLPSVGRSDGNIRLFSDWHLSWLKLIHCLRTTGLPVETVRHYIQLCLEGDATIPERAEIIFRQEKVLRDELRMLHRQMEILQYKKRFYRDLLAGRCPDRCNPGTLPPAGNPELPRRK